ncbi:acyl carrier protein [Kutzneria buriramensis]|uniref:Acyl carrier protein n=1 Tax=Kutzneria buriramensis TaxID=1045776 RepID=A0A3E0GV70_9PSEU|nr:acyl carrier protein [Kutzneria buriramensis]REH26999.1 acyl carrier protein [Kutzneria buriramensis]
MSTALAENADKIKSIVCYILELEPDEVMLDSSFVHDHGVDSMGAIELLAALEREFDVEIEPEQLARMTTLAGVQTVLAEVAGW